MNARGQDGAGRGARAPHGLPRVASPQPGRQLTSVSGRWLGSFALAVALWGCPEPKASRTAGLKVPLPEGYRASATDDGVLRVRLAGRDVMTMEVRPDAPLPGSEALEGAVAQGGGEALGSLALPDGLLMRFRVTGGGEGVLGVRRVGGRRLLCASEPAADQGELKTVARLCSEAQWAAP